MVFLVIGAVALNIYAAVLIIARAAVYRTRLYRPMLWNIFLSVLPVLILFVGILVWIVAAVSVPALGTVVLVLVLLTWLLMLPNASYLITELNFSHRKPGEERVPLWYDIILVISLAMSGVVNTVINVLLVHFFYALIVKDDTRSLTSPVAIATVCTVMILLGVGMYLGRYLRVNSWDVKHPASFARKLVDHFRKLDNCLACAGFTLTYALFLAIIYLTIAGPIIGDLASLARMTAVSD